MREHKAERYVMSEQLKKHRINVRSRERRYERLKKFTLRICILLSHAWNRQRLYYCVCPCPISRLQLRLSRLQLTNLLFFITFVSRSLTHKHQNFSIKIFFIRLLNSFLKVHWYSFMQFRPQNILVLHVKIAEFLY